MRLESGRQAIELRPTRYEFPDRIATDEDWDWDANWLQLSGDVRDGDAAWSFEEPCLTTREARDLLDWLRRAAAGDIEADGGPGSAVLRFTEPNVRFALRERSGDLAIVVVSFAQESSPPGSGEDIRYGEGHGVPLQVSAAALWRAADEWERELAAFPER